MAKLTRIVKLENLDLSQVKLMRDKELQTLRVLKETMERLNVEKRNELDYTLIQFRKMIKETEDKLEMFQKEYNQRQIEATIAKF